MLLQGARYCTARLCMSLSGRTRSHAVEDAPWRANDASCDYNLLATLWLQVQGVPMCMCAHCAGSYAQPHEMPLSCCWRLTDCAWSALGPSMLLYRLQRRRPGLAQTRHNDQKHTAHAPRCSSTAHVLLRDV